MRMILYDASIGCMILLFDASIGCMLIAVAYAIPHVAGAISLY